MQRLCRGCGQELPEKPLLQFRNMPKAAQFLPDASEIEQEKGVDLRVLQCLHCGLVQVDCDPVPYFREVVRASGFSKEMRDFRLKQFADWVDRCSLRGRKVLEIGCGHGEYLELMHAQGVIAHGLEYGEEAVSECYRKGLQVVRGSIVDGNTYLPSSPFHAFLILSYLEHLPDPGAALRKICANLEEDAVGLVEVPNFDLILEKGLFSEFIPDHLHYFTRETLSGLLQRNGFDVLGCEEVWHRYILSASVRKRKNLDLAWLDRRQTELTLSLQDYVQRFGKGNIAIWGAGHQALAVIALSGIAPYIRYVVDSAPFKQGRFTPATHIPIVSPESLETSPVRAILVMAASYSDEVATILMHTFGSRMHAAILRDFGLEVIA